MKIAFFDCHSGISGDMTLAALLDAGASLESVQTGIDSLNLGPVLLSTSAVGRKGFRGLSLSIDHPKEHAHRNLRDIHSLIRRGSISSSAKSLALRIFEKLARAEAKVHGTSIDRVHFHEVGAIDSIVDIVGVAIAWDELEIQRACASPVPVGSGTVKTSHGVLEIPAPATAELLVDVPIASCGLPFEMTTPTGAAILSELVHEYGPLPSMQVTRIGYGAGQRDVPDRPNLLRILIGHEVLARKREEPDDQVVILETNLDDISGEQIGFAIDMAWRHGALDVFSIPIQMKKNRPGVLLTIICRRDDKTAMEQLLVKHTGTLGIRSRRQSRYVVPRAEIEVDTPWGVVRGKVSSQSEGDVFFSPEYDDCSEIAWENGLRLIDVTTEVTECFYAGEPIGKSTAPKKHRRRLSRKPASSDLGSVDSSSERSKSRMVENQDFEVQVNSQLQQAAFEDVDQFLPQSQPVTHHLLGDRVDSTVSEATESLPIDEESVNRFDGDSTQSETYRWDCSPWNPDMPDR